MQTLAEQMQAFKARCVADTEVKEETSEERTAWERHRPRKTVEGWPSAVLHGVAGAREEGLNPKRLHAMADFIETLPLAPLTGGRSFSGCPMGTLSQVRGYTQVVGYMLSGGGGHGYGLSQHGPRAHGSEKSEFLGYWLTGYGLICWGWGTTEGMSAVADNEHVNELHKVLTAEPVVDRECGDLTLTKVTTGLVAEAVREFCTTRDAQQAWRNVAGRWTPEPVNGTAAPQGVVKPQCSVEAPKLTKGEQWKGMLQEERYEELVALCEREAEALAGRIEALKAEQRVWAKRRAAAALFIDDGEGS